MVRSTKKSGETLPGRLLVEGGADFHFFSHLFVKRGLYEKIENKVIPKGFEIRISGDCAQVIEGLIQLKDSDDLEALGIIVDADLDLDKRWQEIRKALNNLNLGYELPEQPDPEGCIVIGEKRLGVWLMPDNQISGILEHFVSWMVPDGLGNPLWKHVEQSIEALPNGPLFPAKDLAKAQLATWLAWQKEPGHPIGVAVSMGYVDHNAPSADNFITWIKRLFQL